MPLDIVVGAQWGDEGKGRITDMLAAQSDMVTRYSGGDNAGHTVTVQGEIFKLHLVPSGVIHEKAVCLIGDGVVINPVVLLREMGELASRGVKVSPDRLKISRGAHLITPAHIALDKAAEVQRGKEAIGTTLRGIGPAYTDKSARSGLRAGLLADPDALAAELFNHTAAKNEVLTKVFDADPLDGQAILNDYVQYANQLKAHLVDGSLLVNEALADGRHVLAEGAQGTFLDLNFGTYPFVTSSHPISGGALVGLGVGPKWVGRVIGVAKAFTSRVGSGPFPCQQEGRTAVRLRGTGENPWDEYGTTTGRPRRVGWLDLVMLRHAVRVNGLTEIVLTKLDILSGLDELPVCVAYELDGRQITHFPSNLDALARCQPVYKTLPGWSEPITDARTPDDLPQNARRYIGFVSENLGIPVTVVSVGPGRAQTVFL